LGVAHRHLFALVRNPGGVRMLDLVLLAAGLGFFALSIAYAIACDRL
jgi:hypothetical protein